ncbi:MarR family winged helix-turn-helix transcriptional regulator [uncultured Robinsoniella sp.]|uniref:MarR family winged helix-turn-helix transcriptional regulator n=1 Tax=uncultured Robinsoniella sp. TaxID=904190 RepID=UPI00374F6291
MSEQFKDLMELFIRADALLHRYQGTYFRNFGPFASPHKGQGRVLSLLKLQPEITQKELGYLLDMRNQSLGELLGKLERSGYITRTPSKKDRRVMNIKLTEEGAKAAEQLDGKQDDVNQIFSCLSDEEQAVLSDYLERLIDALEKTFEELGIPEHEPGRPCGHSRPHPHGHPHQRERDFGGPMGFGKPFASAHDPRASFMGHPGFEGAPKRPVGYGYEETGYAEHPGRHGRKDFCEYAEHPGRHEHEDFSGYAEHPGRHEHEDFSGYAEHPGRHEHEGLDNIVDDSHINSNDIDTKDRNAE